MSLYGDRQQWLGHRPRLQQQRFRLVREGVAGLGPGEPTDPAEVARHHGPGWALLLARGKQQDADALVLVVMGGAVARAEEGREMARDVDRRVGPDGAGEDPDQADPADVRVRGCVHHLGEQWAVRIAGELLAR